MNNLKKIIKNILDIYGVLSKNTEFKDELAYASFIVSLLPIPGLQQATMTLSKISSDASLNQQFNEIWGEVKKLNKDIVNLKQDFEQIRTISGTIKYNSKLNEKFSTFIDEAKQKISNEESSWTMLTINESYQEIIDSIVEADNTKFI